MSLLLALTTSGTGYTLACDAGAYVINGQDASLVYTSGVTAYSLTCDAGSYSIAGQDATFSYSGQVATRNGGVPAWNPYQATGESDEQKRNRRIAQGIIKQAQKPDADIAKLSIKARDVSQRLKADAERFEAFAAQLALELERAYTKRLLAEVMQARNNALATRQLEQQMIAAQLQAEANRQQIEELDVVFMVVMLAAL